MEGIICVIMMALLASTAYSNPGARLTRSYDNVHGGYGPGSDENDASVDGGPPCELFDTSGSREHGYGYDEQPGPQPHGGVSVKAAAAASSSSFK